MARGFLPVLGLALFLTVTSCLSPQTQLELRQAREQVQALQIQVEAAEASQSANLAHLKELLAAAEQKLVTVEEKANNESKENTAAVVEEGAGFLGPIFGAFLPGVAVVLGAVGAGAGAIRRRAAKKRKAAETAGGIS